LLNFLIIIAWYLRGIFYSVTFYLFYIFYDDDDDGSNGKESVMYRIKFIL
jgi:hypothetical protein